MGRISATHDIAMASSTSSRGPDSTQGFGHFYFVPRRFKRDYRSSRRKQLVKADRKPELIDESSLTDLEMPPFPFMKLPLEIRYIIYKLLIAPLLQNRSGWLFTEEFPGVTMGAGFRYRVYETEHGDLGDAVQVWQPPCYEVEIRDRHLLPSMEEEAFGDSAHSFNLASDCVKECAAIHHLSHVSRQFTSELGACLWGTSIIDFQCPELFFEFFENRPQIFKYVKGISLCIYWINIDDSVNFGALLLRISKFVSQYLDIRVFSVRVVPDYRGLNDISKFKRLKSWTTAFRGLKVKDRFIVHVDSYTMVLKLDQKLNELSRKLSELWLPDTLRVAETKA